MFVDRDGIRLKLLEEALSEDYLDEKEKFISLLIPLFFKHQYKPEVNNNQIFYEYSSVGNKFNGQGVFEDNLFDRIIIDQ